MAENQEDRSNDDLTEQESPFRLEEYRQKGMVAQSREVNGLLALIAVSATIYMTAPNAAMQIATLMKEFFKADVSAKANFQTSVSETLYKVLKVAVAIGLPACLAGFVIAILTSFSQIGSIFSMEPLTPDFSKIDPIGGMKKLFSGKHMVESALVIFKVTVILFLVYKLIRPQVLSSASFQLQDISAMGVWFASAFKAIFWPIILVMAVFAGFDFWVNKRDYSKKLRLTKSEAKQEFKEREGDPQIKARIKAVQREMARRRMMNAVKKADVIVTNPTHIAIAISYDKDKMAAPKVVAKGADFVAQKIKQIALDAGVPMVENVPLARAIFKSVKIGQTIPRTLYQAVAEVLAYVYRLKNRSKI